MNQGELKPIQASGPSQNILVDHRIGEEVHHCPRSKAESHDFDLVPIRVEHTIRRPKTSPNSGGQIEPQSLRDLGTEDTKGGSRIKARSNWDSIRARVKHDRDYNTFITSRIVVDSREFQTVHDQPGRPYLPAAEWQIGVLRNARKKRI